MKHVEYKTQNTCARVISFDITDDNKLTNLQFHGGCNGNLKAIAKLCEGQHASHIITLLQGNTCGMRSTSCADQLTKAIEHAIN